MLHNWCFCWSKNYSHWGKLSWIQMKFVSEMLQHSAGYSERHRFACCGHSFGLSSDRSSQRLRTTVFAFLKVALLAFWQWETEIAKAWNKWPGALAPLRPAVVTEDFSLLSFFKKHSLAPLRFWIRMETFLNGAWREYRLTDAAQAEKAGTHSLTAFTHAHILTHYRLMWRWIKHHCHQKTMKIHKNNEKVKVEIHRTDLFVLYNTVCCFALDRHPRR